MSSIAMSAFATLGRTCLVPGIPGHRSFVRARHPRPPMRSSDAFQLCHLNKQHMGFVAVTLSIVTLLLVIFAYHGGYGVGSWFYSLLVVISGLAFVVFGPLLLCRFLMHAYYRQIEARSIRPQVEPSIQISEVIEDGRRHVYACIIIAPDDVARSFGTTSRLSNLPTYDEAVQQHCYATSQPVQVGDVSLEPNSSCFNGPSDMQGASLKSVSNNHSPQFNNKDDTPPPTYHEALTIIAQGQRRENEEVIDMTDVEQIVSSSSV